MTPYNVPLEPLQWRHMGVKPSQITWSLFMRIKLYTSKLHLTGFWERNSPQTGRFPSKRASIVESISTPCPHHSSGVLVHEKIITRTMITKTHCLQWRRCHDMDTLSASQTLYQGTPPLDWPKRGSIMQSFRVLVLLSHVKRRYMSGVWSCFNVWH